MNGKTILKTAACIVCAFLVGCATALLLRWIDSRDAAIAPIPGGQTIDFSAYGFTLTVPDGFSLNDYTTNNRAEGGNAVFAGCAYEGERELYIFCYDNEAGDSIADYGEQELVTYYMGAGASDVRLRTLGGRRFICYRVRVEAGGEAQAWDTYETWDSAHQLTFETRMEPGDVLPILATVSFTD
ncbi:MAG: hypothetical protein PUH70_14115 [Clostridiales bacterium]|nr:hypothetical protein [Clostridiales bacterium]MDY5515684.1 hypothetical protein [Candidatus Ventricola sp.]